MATREEEYTGRNFNVRIGHQTTPWSVIANERYVRVSMIKVYNKIDYNSYNWEVTMSEPHSGRLVYRDTYVINRKRIDVLNDQKAWILANYSVQHSAMHAGLDWHIDGKKVHWEQHHARLDCQRAYRECRKASETESCQIDPVD